MLLPRRAVVRPRVVSPETDDTVLLEDEFDAWLNSRSLTFEIVGGPGSGKTTALEHLMAVFGPLSGICWFDDYDADKHISLGRTVYTTGKASADSDQPSLELASWTDDELLEYCLVRNREHCSSILERCRAMADRDRLDGVPLLWSIVLESFAREPVANDWRKVVTDELRGMVPEHLFARVGEYCLSLLLRFDDRTARIGVILDAQGRPLSKLPLLAQPSVQAVLAASSIVTALEENRTATYLAATSPRAVIDESARLVPDSPIARQKLLEVLSGKAEALHATAATLLHKSQIGWQPTPRSKAKFNGADFAGAVWPGIDLSHARLEDIDFTGADLSMARLDSIAGCGIKLPRANLRGANLSDANICDAVFSGANLSESVAILSSCHRADFRNADLNRANFYTAYLQEANFAGARLVETNFHGAFMSRATVDGADFTRADLRSALLNGVRLSSAILDGARLANANLAEADLEGVELPDADFQNANLTRAYLTGASMPRANFRGAILIEAGLADVNWEGADLRDADFKNCAFHLGSSRSGLVGSPIACEGSRTGFYTDDFLEQDFKSPEEIRKANLRGADLRGAFVENADFYLVDLRGARYTTEQANHFRRCGAILVDRVAGKES